MICPACQAAIPDSSTFCQKCGAATGVAQTATPVGTVATAPRPVAAAGLSENAAAAIAYLTFIPAIIFLVLEPYNKMRLVKFHAIQCLGLTVVAVLVRVAALFMVAISSYLFLAVESLISIVLFIAWVLCIVKASQGQYFKLPVIGDFAEKQANS